MKGADMPQKLLSVVAVASAVMVSTSAWADSDIFAVPTNWRLQNYVSSQGVVAWFTGSNCTNGLVSFDSSASADDKNRFYSTVLTAKISGKAVGIFYETTSGACHITSFYLQQ